MLPKTTTFQLRLIRIHIQQTENLKQQKTTTFRLCCLQIHTRQLNQIASPRPFLLKPGNLNPRQSIRKTQSELLQNPKSQPLWLQFCCNGAIRKVTGGEERGGRATTATATTKRRRMGRLGLLSSLISFRSPKGRRCGRRRDLSQCAYIFLFFHSNLIYFDGIRVL